MKIGIVLASEVWGECLGLLLSSMAATASQHYPRVFLELHSLLEDIRSGTPYDLLILDERAWRAMEDSPGIPPGRGLVLLTHEIDLSLLRAVFEGGAEGKGYLLWRDLDSSSGLASDLERIKGGRCIISPTIMAEHLQAQYSPGHKNRMLKETLTRRELEVLKLMAMAKGNEDIAAALWVGSRTVEHHINSIFSKLDINSENGTHGRVAAVLKYISSLSVQEIQEMKKEHLHEKMGR